MPDARRLAPIARRYEFFGRIVGVETDSEEVADSLDIVYERQRTIADVEPDVVVSITALAEGGPIVVVGPRTVRVPDPTQLVHYAHLVLVNVAASDAKGRVVLHAGAVVAGTGSVILVGSSGWGKTTLTMELVRRGFGFLSDDFAVLRPDGVVEPFARRVNLTDDSAALLGLTPTDHDLRLSGFGGQSKWMVDVESLFPECLSGPVPLAAAFLLPPRGAAPSEDDSANGTETRPDRPWQLEFDHLPPGFEAALAGIVGVGSVAVLPGPKLPVRVTLHTINDGALQGRPSSVVQGLDDLCAAWNVTVLSARRDDSGAPAFSGPASGDEVDLTAALPTLLSHSLSLSGRRFLYGTDNQVVMTALAHLRRSLESSGARIYRLTPGDLTMTADLVERLAAEAER